MALATGASPQRGTRPSQCLMHWRSRRVSLTAYSGQVGVFSPVFSTTAGGTIGRVGTAVTVGRGMPRWEQHPSSNNVTRLLTEGEVTGQDSENLVFSFPLRVMAITVYWRVWPMYTVAQTISPAAYGVMIGTATTGGGWMALRRSGTDWHLHRKRGAVEITSVVSETGLTFPLDVLGTMTSGGGITLTVRDSTATPITRVGSTATDANMAITTEIWGGSQLTLCGVQGLVAPGGRWRHEICKVARGVKTLSEMEALS